MKSVSFAVKGEIPDNDRKKYAHQTVPVTCQFLPECRKETEVLTRPKFPSTTAAQDIHNTMQAAIWEAPDKVVSKSRPKVLVTDPGDCVVRITSSTICGSDLHLYHAEVPSMEKGDVLGHECMGVVEAVGQNCHLNIGERVVVSAVISCGTCAYCERGWPSLCDNTNPSTEMEKLYGHRIAGVFGYSHLTGGYEGGQAEYIRVPYADINTLCIPEGLPDEKVLFLSDILCTGWHANELGGVGKDCTVAIWGAGPVGLMAAMWAKFRGASRIVMIDNLDYRLEVAATRIGGGGVVKTINFAKDNVVETMKKLIPHGPDVCIECVGFRFPKSMLHKVQRSLHLESDDPEILAECIKCCRKGGTIACIGDYFGLANGFPIGPLMEKAITFRGGQVYVQRYWKQLLGYIEKGLVDPTFVITHKMPIEQVGEAYQMFDHREDNVLKIILQPSKVTAEK